MRRLVLFIFILLLSLTNFAYGASNEAINAADKLYILELFSGIGKDQSGKPIFDLDREPSRQEAITVLVKLLGKEDEAKSTIWSHPFNDVDPWAQSFVGYAYKMGLTSGTGPTTFGSNEKVTSPQFLTFILKALGYKSDIDFSWDKAFELSDQIGLTKGDYTGIKTFTRGDLAIIAYRSLSAQIKDAKLPTGKPKTLANKLLWEDVFSTDQLANTYDGSLLISADMPDFINDETIVNNAKEFEELMMLSLRNHQFGLGIKVKGMKKDEILEVYNQFINKFNLYEIESANAYYCWDGYIYSENSLQDYMFLQHYYEDPERYKKNSYFLLDGNNHTELNQELEWLIPEPKMWVEKIDSIISAEISNKMTTVEKVKALHDYLVLSATFDDNCFEGTYIKYYPQSVMFFGVGVNEAYAGAFKMLMNGADIECKVIFGNTPYGESVWNQVKIDGEWVNVDVTWDDPDENNSIYYDYFCVPDIKFLLDHEPFAESNAESCTSAKFIQ